MPGSRDRPATENETSVNLPPAEVAHERTLWNLGYRRVERGDIQARMEAVRLAYRTVETVLYQQIPYCRELALARTSLEQSCMEAIAALARNQNLIPEIPIPPMLPGEFDGTDI